MRMEKKNLDGAQGPCLPPPVECRSALTGGILRVEFFRSALADIQPEIVRTTLNKTNKV